MVICDEHDRDMEHDVALAAWWCPEPGCGRELPDEDVARLACKRPGVAIRVT